MSALRFCALSCLLLIAAAGGHAEERRRIGMKDASILAAPHVRFVYAIASDAEDRRLDQTGYFLASLEVIQLWLTENMRGQTLRIARHADGEPKVLFVRLDQTQEEYLRRPQAMRSQIERQLHVRGLLHKDQIYLVFYDGVGPTTCGHAPAKLEGFVAVKWLMSLQANKSPCALPVRLSDSKPGYFEFSVIHEIFHLLGAAPKCAPNATRDEFHHVSDDPRDIMYGGPEPWRPAIIDVGNDDYYGHGRRDCLDLINSRFLTPPLKP